MDLKEIYALVDFLVDEKMRDIDLPKAKRGLRGPRGLDGPPGKDGKDGVDGKSFSWDENKEKILQKIKEHKLKFSDLTEDEKRSLRGPRGQRGKQGLRGEDGKDGKSFVWDEHVKNVYELLKNHKDEFKGEKGDPGKKGERGLRGYKGVAGRDGKDGKDGLDFSWDDHKEKIFDRIDKNKITFKDLSDDEKEEIRGYRGPRGQRGKQGKDGLSAYEIWLENNEGSKLDFLKSLKGRDGKNGLNGLNGTNGKNGINGSDGQDGLDAPVIIDIQIKELRGKFYFVFYLSDGTRIETNSVEKPAVESIIQQTYISKSGGSGSAATELEIYKDNILLGIADELDFVGDNINVTYDSETKRATISVDEPVIPDPNCVGVYDEGSEITDCAQTIDFIGDNVQVVGATTLSDWEALSDVTSLANYTVGTNQNVKVVISGQESVAKLGLTKTASENISQFDLVRLVSNNEVAKGSSDSADEAKISGIALNSASAGEDVTFVMFGVVEDNSFNFPLLSKLFLQSNGTLGTTAPSTSGQYVVASGESLGTGAIFIKIEEPEGIV